ncbi:MAG: hydrogenase maturation nickel metallochaperone HypA [Candidatus Margulisiibacteriota bacterium]|jgi:hydrogenase nickel incorporation protein HypA/HybF
MHEKHQVEQLVKTALDLATKEGLKKVTEIDLEIGEGLGFDETSINLYFETFSEDTLLEGAKIKFIWHKAKLLCPKCNSLFEKNKSELDCPKCKVQGKPTDTGKEFFISKIF